MVAVTSNNLPLNILIPASVTQEETTWSKAAAKEL
jgi:hypothetical protein